MTQPEKIKVRTEQGVVHIVEKERIGFMVPGNVLSDLGSPTPRSREWREFLALPKMDLPALAQEYVDVLSNATTQQLCTCTWVEAEVHGKVQPKRMEEHPLCPQHARVGFLLGLFEWAFRNTSDTLSKWRVMSGEDSATVDTEDKADDESATVTD